MKRLVPVCAVLMAVPLLMGATIGLSKVTPNPQGMPGVADLDGKFRLDEMEMYVGITVHAKNREGVEHTNTAFPKAQERLWWGRIRDLSADEWEFWAVLQYRIAGDMTLRFKQSNSITRFVR